MECARDSVLVLDAEDPPLHVSSLCPPGHTSPEAPKTPGHGCRVRSGPDTPAAVISTSAMSAVASDVPAVKVVTLPGVAFQLPASCRVPDLSTMTRAYLYSDSGVTDESYVQRRSIRVPHPTLVRAASTCSGAADTFVIACADAVARTCGLAEVSRLTINAVVS